MIYSGEITKINVAEAPLVDCIISGSLYEEYTDALVPQKKAPEGRRREQKKQVSARMDGGADNGE